VRFIFYDGVALDLYALTGSLALLDVADQFFRWTKL